MIETRPQNSKSAVRFSLAGVRRQFQLVVILLGIMAFWPVSALAQQPKEGGWTPFQRVPDYADITQPPVMLADQNRTVHAFTSQWMNPNSNGRLAILYRQWSVAGGWTTPVDVLLSPFAQARMQGAFLDPHGMAHVIFFGGDDSWANIYHSSAPLVNAGRATAWSAPKAITGLAITPDSAALAGDEEGHLVVIYNGKMERVGLFSVFSADYGRTWSEPIPVLLDYTGSQMPAGVRLSMGASGYVYAVWNMADERGHNVSGKFARFDLKTQQWTEATDFAESIGVEEGMGIMNADVLEYKEQVLVRYNNGIPPEGIPPAEWIQSSNDLGRTWSAPQQAFPGHVGRNGVASFAVDSNRNLHLLFAQRRPFTVNGAYTAIGGAWYSQLLPDNRWSEPLLIADNDQYPDIAFDAYDVRAVMVQGNVLLATWRSDPGGAQNGVWYTYATLNAPELPAQPLPEPAPTPTRPHLTTAASATTIVPTATSRPFIPAEGTAENVKSNDTAIPIITGVATALIIIGLIVIIKLYSSGVGR